MTAKVKKTASELCRMVQNEIPETKDVSLKFVRAKLPSGRTWFLQIGGLLPEIIHAKTMHFSEELALTYELEDKSGNQSS